MKTNRVSKVLALLACLLQLGCEQKAPEKPMGREIFKSQFLQYLREGNKLSLKWEAGIDFETLKADVMNVKVTFGLIKATWPSDFPSEALQSFERSQNGYALAVHLWNSKLRGRHPYEGEKSWDAYMQYGKKVLETEVWGPNEGKERSGKRYITFDEDNISALLKLAGADFEKGQDLAFKQLK